MGNLLKHSVGRGGKNFDADSRIVQKLLNRHIEDGSLSHLAPVHVSGNGADTGTVNAIDEFQSKVLKFKNPDGKVDPGGKTIKALRKTPKDTEDIVLGITQAMLSLAAGPIGTIPVDLWNETLFSQIKHAKHEKLLKFDIVTMVDFRTSRDQKRLWVVNLKSREILFHTRVAHGKNSGGKIPTSFSNVLGSNQSSVGAFVTTFKTRSSAGKLGTNPDGSKKFGPALIIEGLDQTNDRLRRRQVIFHGASYVTETWVGNSLGCFSTRPQDNNMIIDVIRDGTMGYAYAGEKWKEK